MPFDQSEFHAGSRVIYPNANVAANCKRPSVRRVCERFNCSFAEAGFGSVRQTPLCVFLKATGHGRLRGGGDSAQRPEPCYRPTKRESAGCVHGLSSRLMSFHECTDNRARSQGDAPSNFSRSPPVCIRRGGLAFGGNAPRIRRELCGGT